MTTFLTVVRHLAMWILWLGLIALATVSIAESGEIAFDCVLIGDTLWCSPVDMGWEV